MDRYIIWPTIPLLLASLTLPTFAQQDMASDNEMFAAYCLGAAPADTQRAPVGVATIDEPLQHAKTYDSLRLWGYLNARGFYADNGRGTQAKSAIQAAMTQGSTARQICRQQTDRCSRDCASGKDIPSCLNSCRKIERACNDVDRCEADHIPF